MKEELMTKVMQQMLPYLDNAQLKQLRQAMEQTLCHYDIIGVQAKPEENDSNDFIAMFIAAKRIEGCSEKTLKYYQTTIDALVSSLGKNVRHILTEDLWTYLTEYQKKNWICKDNVVAEYSLEEVSQPIGIAGYELSNALSKKYQRSLPTIETLA